MTLGDPCLTTLLMERAHDLLSHLAAQRQANCHTYGAVASMHAALGDVDGLRRVLAQMDDQAVPPEGLLFASLAKACESCWTYQIV